MVMIPATSLNAERALFWISHALNYDLLKLRRALSFIEMMTLSFRPLSNLCESFET